MDNRRIGDFELLGTLGEGAAGVAYRARHVETGEMVAVKVLGDAVANEQEMQQRFVREASVAAKLDHPGIVRFHDCGLHDDRIYFAMELVDAGALDEVLSNGGILPWREACEVAAQTCAALAHAHQHGVVHRDLKPANLFLTSDGQVKVGDFGLARDNQSHRLTIAGQTVGTCRFMAPEQVRGESELGGEVDVYAMGCLLFLMMTGDCPFNGSSVVEVFEHHLFTPPPSLASRAPGCPPELDKLVARLLSKNAADRPDAAATERALKAVLNGDAVDLPAPAAAADGAAAQPVEARNLTQRLKERAAPRERKVSKTGLIVAAALVLIAVIAAVASQAGRADAPGAAPAGASSTP